MPFPFSKQCGGDLASSTIQDGANRKAHVSVREGQHLQCAYPDQVNAQSECQPLGGGYSHSQPVKAARPPGHYDALDIVDMRLALFEEGNHVGNKLHSMILSCIPGDFCDESASIR
ncbi:MAG: hypothetical protein DDT27_01279 [Dehalococcoidia bacterium]|nr:hypothetical protein [Chloroflexota bacterium]